MTTDKQSIARAIRKFIEENSKTSIMINSMMIMIILAIFVGILLIIIKFTGINITSPWINVNQIGRLEPRLEVNASSGWVNSGVYVKQGQRVTVAPSGRVQLAMNHAVNSAQLVKPIVLHNIENFNIPNIDKLKEAYPVPSLVDTNVFYRAWTGPVGDRTPSDVFEDCKLQRRLGWGALLCLIIDFDNPHLSEDDPFTVLNTAIKKKSEIRHISDKMEFIAENDGYICFIVNEAVMSDDADAPPASIAFNKAMRKALRQSTSTNDTHKYDETKIPLMLFNDNLGSFSVGIEVK